MTASKTTLAFFDAILDRFMEPASEPARWWLRDARQLRSGAIDGKPQGFATYALFSYLIAERGVYRCQGGQGDRPEHIGPKEHAEVNAAHAELDVELLSPLTISYLLQVGLFGKVMFPGESEGSQTIK